MSQLQIVVVTPEQTTVDETVESGVVPMIDGELGILEDHAPLIGRLGPGELRVRGGKGTSRYYVDGGFVQILNNVVSVLTGNSMPVDQIDVSQAREDLKEAERQPADTPELMELKRKAIAQAQAQIRMVEGV